MMFPKRLLALILFAALAAMPPCVLRAQWQPTNGLYGGEIQSIVESNSALFVRIEGYDVFRSTDGGITWLSANQGLPFSSGNLVSDGTHVFVGSSDQIYMWSDDSMSWASRSSFGNSSYGTPLGVKGNYLYTNSSEGIYRSTNLGSTWKEIDTGITELGNLSVTSFKALDSFLFVGMTYNGIFRSSDNGDHWIQLDSGMLTPDIFCLATEGKTLFAGSYDGVLRSTDFGASWQSVDSGLPVQNIYSLAVLGNTIVASAPPGLYISNNSGASWQLQSSGLIKDDISAMTFTFNGDTLLAGTYWGVFLSVDTGRTWISAHNLVSKAASELLVQGSSLYAGGETFYTSTDSGMNWNIPVSKVWLDSIYTFGSIFSLVSQGGNIFAASSGIFLTTDSGVTWTLKENGLPNASIQCLAVEGSKVFAGTDGQGVFVSTDSGESWTDANNGLPSKSRVFSFCAIGSYIVAGLGNGVGSTTCVFFSSDGGQSWISRNSGFDSYDEGCNLVASIDTTVFVDEDNGLYRSSIHDMAWTRLSLPSYNVTSFAKIDTTIFVGTQQGLFASYDNGDNWVEVDSGITYPSILSLAIYDSMLFVGTSSGGANYPSIPTIWRRPLSEMSTSPHILGASADTINFGKIPVGKDSLQFATVTNDGTDSLTIQSFQLTPGQNNFSTSDLSSEVNLNPGESFTFEVFFMPTEAGTFSANIGIVSEAKKINITLIGSADGVAGVERPPQLPSILSAFPNPFSQSTQITFTSPSAGYAEVSIVNMLGVEVARLFSGELGAGEHSFAWDAGENAYASQGMYECVVRMNGKVETLPMVKF